MGYYIEVPEHKGKAQQLIELYGAVLIEQPKSLDDLPNDKALIVVLHNLHFEAAGYAYCTSEWSEFTRPDDQRPREFLLMDKKRVMELTHFQEMEGI